MNFGAWLTRGLRRLGWSVATLVGTAFLTFLLMRTLPGDVARVIAGPKATPEVLEAVRTKHHLNEPARVQLAAFFGGLLRGDLGESSVTGQPVLESIMTRLPCTAALVGLAMVLWLAIALPLGVYTATHRGSWVDRGVLVGAAFTLSLPAFWLARMLQYFLAYRWGWFPVAGYHGAAHLVLPALSLAILAAGYYARLVHVSLSAVLASPFILAARARGIGPGRVLWVHGLRSALIPVVTVLGMDVAMLLGGVVFTENVFALPGIGMLAVQSVFNLDVPTIMGVVVFSSVIVTAANLLVDFAYGWIDPRVRTLS